MPTTGPTTPSPGPGYVWDPDAQQWVPPPQGGQHSTTSTGPVGLPSAVSGAISAGTSAVTSGTATAGAANTGWGTAGGPLVDAKTNAPVTTGTFDTPNPDGSVTAGKDPNTAYVGAKAGENDVRVARMNRDDLLDAYWNYQNRGAPQAAAPGAIPVANAATPTVGAAAPVNIPTVGPAATATAAPVGPAAQATAATVGPAAQVGPVTVGPAAQIGPVGQISATGVQAGAIDTAPQAQFRTGQEGLIQRLQGVDAGTAPSAAQAQLQRAYEDAASQQLAMVGMNHGRGANAALRTAGRTVASLQSKAALDAAQVRAQEAATARGQEADVLGQGRSADIGLATTGAQLQQQASTTTAQLALEAAKSNQGANVDVAKANVEAQNQLTALQAQISSQGGIANAEQANQLKALQAQLSTQTATTNAEQQNQLNSLQAQLSTSTSVANMQARNQLTALQAQIQAQGGIATAEQQNQLTSLQAQLSSATNIANANNANTTARQWSAQETQTNLANLDAQLKARGMDDQQRDEYLRAYLAANGQVLDVDTAYNAQQAGQKSTGEKAAGYVEEGAKIGAALAPLAASDRRVKENIRDAPAEDEDEFLDTLAGAYFQYKNRKHGDGTFYGPMAQDLERSKIGRTLVRPDDEGVKRIDTGRLALALASAVAASMKRRGKR